MYTHSHDIQHTSVCLVPQQSSAACMVCGMKLIVCECVPQPCHEKYGMGYLERARLGQIWQPWYAALMEQGGLVGSIH